MVAITINGAPCDASTSHFSLSTCQIQDMVELTKLQLFSELRSASFAGTNLDDIGLAHVARVKTIENLNLQDTEVSDAGLACLVNLPNLQYLRLKGNPQLSNACIPHLQRLMQLVDLQVHETSIHVNAVAVSGAITRDGEPAAVPPVRMNRTYDLGDLRIRKGAPVESLASDLEKYGCTLSLMVTPAVGRDVALVLDPQPSVPDRVWAFGGFAGANSPNAAA